MNIVESSTGYERWLADRIPLLATDLKKKHELMAQDEFSFFRATFYRWAQVWPMVCDEAASAPVALAIGDLHVENFGTWRDAEGRLVWGINDFDEACNMPYTCDLVRLATSALLAIAAGHLKLSAGDASQSILDGYTEALHRGGEPTVLSGKHSALRTMAVERLKDPKAFWDKLESIATLRSKIPGRVAKALHRAIPEGASEVRVLHRVSGLGSLGRRRFVAIANWRGAYVAREAKELAESAWYWAHPPKGKAAKRMTAVHYEEVLRRAIRCPDPFVELRDPWIVRRLAPDCSRIELSSLPSKHDANRLLRAMGWETANVHLGSISAKKLQADLKARPKDWLKSNAETMLQETKKDWMTWRRAQKVSK